jgi:hypothetical protein
MEQVRGRKKPVKITVEATHEGLDELGRFIIMPLACSGCGHLTSRQIYLDGQGHVCLGCDYRVVFN